MPTGDLSSASAPFPLPPLFLTAAGHEAGGFVIEPVSFVEASLHRRPGGNPKSSLGGPRTTREVAGYNINHSRSAWRASYSKRAWAFAVRAGRPGRRSASYSAKPNCFLFNFLRGSGNQFHAACLFIAFIVVFPIVPVAQKDKTRRSFRLSGFCGEFLAGDAEVYSVVLPESGRSFTAPRAMPCAKQDAGASGRMDGR
jgi:hypothetical protein